MTDEDLRQLVRETVARHLVQPASLPVRAPGAASSWVTHPSHARFALPQGADTDGPCLIEPTVGCTHCGYCQSWGH